MMTDIIYGLCAITALFCTVMLIRAYLKTKYRLLLWGGLCFASLTINNILLVLDKIVMEQTDLSMWRSITALSGMIILLYGLIWEKE